MDDMDDTGRRPAPQLPPDEVFSPDDPENTMEFPMAIFRDAAPRRAAAAPVEYEPPEPEPEPPAPARKHTGVISLIVVIVLVLLAAGGGVFWYLQSQDDPSKPVVAGQAGTPQAAVRGYLQAVAAGNSTIAMLFMAQPPTDATFLNDTVLAAGKTAQPITDITAVGSKQSQMVQATYNLGGQPVEQQYQVVKVGRYYFVKNPTMTVDIQALVAADSSIRINGILAASAQGTTVQLFPGAYEITVDNPLVQLTSTNGFVISDTSGTLPLSVELVSNDGFIEQLRTSATAALKGCLKQKTSLTTCGFGALQFQSSSTEVLVPKANSTKWSLSGGSKADFSGAEFSWDASKPTVATADIKINVLADFTIANGKEYKTTFNLFQVTVDFTDAQNWVVTIAGQ